MRTIETPVEDMTIGAPYVYGAGKHSKIGKVTDIQWAGRKDRTRILVEVTGKDGKVAVRATHNVIGTFDQPAPVA